MAGPRHWHFWLAVVGACIMPAVEAEYVVRHVGNCNIDGARYIEESDTCRRAARALGLETGDPYRDSLRDSPLGCYWSTDTMTVNFNPDGERHHSSVAAGLLSICTSEVRTLRVNNRDCEGGSVVGNCFTDGRGSHRNNEDCTATTLTSGTLMFLVFDVEHNSNAWSYSCNEPNECGCDSLSVGDGEPLCGDSLPPNREISSGTRLRWRTDWNIRNRGFTVCVMTPDPTASPVSAPTHRPTTRAPAPPVGGRWTPTTAPSTRAPTTPAPSTRPPTTPSPTHQCEGHDGCRTGNSYPAMYCTRENECLPCTSCSPTRSVDGACPTACSPAPTPPAPTVSAPTSPSPPPPSRAPPTDAPDTNPGHQFSCRYLPGMVIHAETTGLWSEYLDISAPGDPSVPLSMDMAAGGCRPMWTHTLQEALANVGGTLDCTELPFSRTPETATAPESECRALFVAALAPLAPRFAGPPVSAPTASSSSTSGSAGGEDDPNDGLGGGVIFLLVVVFGIIPIAIVAVYLKRRADQGSQGSQGAPKGAKRPRGPDRSRSQAPEFAAFGHPEHTRLQAASLFSEDGATRPVDGLANPQYVVTSSSSGVSTLQHLYAASDGGIVLNEAGVEPDSNSSYNSMTTGGKITRHNFAPQLARLRQSMKKTAITHKPVEISRDNLELGEVIGKGNFGVVRKALWNNRQKRSVVAVKQLESTLAIDRAGFLEEAALAAQFNHKNVSRLLGVATVDDPMLLVIELYANGSLQLCLQGGGKRRLAQPEKVVALYGIARGMAYLSALSFVHRDLATRNILLDSNYVTKVTDFGMSRKMGGTDIGGNEIYAAVNTKLLPLRWTAPEAIKMSVFSTASDVFSFGIVTIEVYTHAVCPYLQWSDAEVMRQVAEGYKIRRPSHCPKELYRDVTSPCLCLDPTDRPTFAALVKKLKQLGGVAQREKPRQSKGAELLYDVPTIVDSDDDDGAADGGYTAPIAIAKWPEFDHASGPPAAAERPTGRRSSSEVALDFGGAEIVYDAIDIDMMPDDYAAPNDESFSGFGFAGDDPEYEVPEQQASSDGLYAVTILEANL